MLRRKQTPWILQPASRLSCFEIHAEWEFCEELESKIIATHSYHPIIIIRLILLGRKTQEHHCTQKPTKGVVWLVFSCIKCKNRLWKFLIVDWFYLISDSQSSDEDSDTPSQTEENNSESSYTDQEFLSDLSESEETNSESETQDGFSSEEDVSEGEQPVCQGTSIKRRTFEATFLALSNKHNFSKSTRTNILKLLEAFIPKPNLPSSNYMFEKKLIEAMDIRYSKYELCVCCNTTINEGKCPNENCDNFNRKLNDHEIEICYFIPIKDQLQRILTGTVCRLNKSNSATCTVQRSRNNSNNIVSWSLYTDSILYVFS